MKQAQRVAGNFRGSQHIPDGVWWEGSTLPCGLIPLTSVILPEGTKLPVRCSAKSPSRVCHPDSLSDLQLSLWSFVLHICQVEGAFSACPTHSSQPPGLLARTWGLHEGSLVQPSPWYFSDGETGPWRGLNRDLLPSILEALSVFLTQCL